VQLPPEELPTTGADRERALRTHERNYSAIVMPFQQPPTQTGINATATYQYWDYLEGDALVCSPLGPPEYNLLCNTNQFIFGISFLVHGALSLYNARRLQRLQETVVDATVGGSSNNGMSPGTRPPKRHANLEYFAKLSRTFFLQQCSYGASQLVAVCGTLHPPSTTEGLVGDALLSVTIATVMYIALLHLRRAEAFIRIVDLPSSQTSERKRGGRILFTRILNDAQGPGALPITFGVWGLLASGLIGRPAFCSVMYSIICFTGGRSMIENIFERGRTLIRVNDLQQRAGGSVDALHRRRNILKNKLRRWIVFAIGIGSTTVFVPASVVIFGSVYSSTQLLIHNSVFNTILFIAWTHVCNSTHRHVDAKYARLRKLGPTTGGQNVENTSQLQSEYTVANESGLSMVAKTDFEVAKAGAGTRGGGLFSSVSTEPSSNEVPK
jgi:hypothetical protein